MLSEEARSAFSHARWIWCAGHTDTPNFYMYARKEFEFPDSGSATGCLTCSSEYRLFVNGRPVGRGPGPCHPESQCFDIYDFTHVLRSGRNVIAVLCYNYGVETHFRPRTPGGLLLQLTHRAHATTEAHQPLEAGTSDGESVLVATENSWRVLPGRDWDWNPARMPPMAGFHEVYDSRLKPVGWNVVGFDDSSWDEPLVVGEVGVEPWTSLVPREIPHLREAEACPQVVSESADVRYARSLLNGSGECAEIAPGANAVVKLDFGRIVVGYPRLRLRDGGMASIDLSYGETSEAGSRADAANGGHLQADRVVLHGGRQDWKAFGRRAFRHIQLAVRSGDTPVHIESVSVDTVGYPVERVSSFECSDEVLNEAWRAGVYYLSTRMQDVYEECPLQSHSESPAGARVQALQNYYCFGDALLAANSLRRFAQQRHDDLLWAVMLHDHYLFNDDSALVERLYPSLRLLLEDSLRQQESENGMLTREAQGEVAALNAFYYQALRDASKLAAALGRHEDAVEWHARAENVLCRFNERFWSPSEGAYLDYVTGGNQSDSLGARANALAVLYGLAASERAQLVGDFLLSGRGTADSAGSHLDLYVLQALAKLGRVREALDLIRSTWGQGTQRAESLCSPGSGAPVCFLPAEVLGVKPTVPESRVVVVQPRVGDLEWARGRVVMKSAVVEVAWRRELLARPNEPEHFEMEITAPEGFIAALPISGFRDPQVEEIDLTPETPERRARKTYGWGNVIWRNGAEHDPYLDWLHSQEEEPPEHYRSPSRCHSDGDFVWVRECPTTRVRYEVCESR